MVGVAVLATVAACGDSDDGTGPAGPTGPRGDFRVETVTTGAELDVEYGIGIDGIVSSVIGANDSTTFSDFAVATYSLELVDVAQNCVVEGDNPRPLTVVEADIVATTFEVACLTTTGILEVVTSTSGVNPDDGYSLAVDGEAVGTIGANDVARTGDLVTGEHTLRLGSIALNCLLGGDARRSVDVPSEGVVTSTYEIFCTDQTGDLRITTVTSAGLSAPSGYDVIVEWADPAPMGANDVMTLGSVAPGLARVSLDASHLPPDCTVMGENPRTVTISVGSTTDTTFEVDCGKP